MKNTTRRTDQQHGKNNTMRIIEQEDQNKNNRTRRAQ